MKIKKWLATVLGCTLAVSTAACAGVFAACGNGDEKNPSPGGETTPAYQFLGMMDDDDLSSYGMQCALWLQLDSDGTASIDKYSYLSYDASPAAENKNYQADFMVGTWEKTERDGVEGVSIEVGVKQEDGSMKGVTAAMAYNRGGKYSCELTIPIVGLGVEASALLSQKGFNADSDHSKQLGLDVPVSLKYTFGLGKTLGIYLAAGPDFYFDFKGEKNGVERKRAQVGINVGGGVKLFRHLQVGVNYNIPTGDHFSLKGAGSAIVKGKDKTWQVSLAYMF